jgi:threonine dehydrogenase-like Zn-dependent dehydrogenase
MWHAWGMLAVHLENGVVSMRDVPVPQRAPGFALLKLIAAGICNTDLELQRGYYGFCGIPGHEFVAEVVEADRADLVGKRVVGEINLACAECEWCRKGLGRHCGKRSVLGIVRHPGAFAEFLTLPERNLHVLPNGMAVERAIFAEPLAAACEILDQVTIPYGETVAVLGDGKLGLLVAMVLNAHGYPVHLFGRHPAKMALAARVGVTVAESVGQPLSCDYDWVVEATGSAGGLLQATAMTRPRGTVILKSTLHGEVAIDTAPVVVNELTLIGSRCGRFEVALPLLDHHLIPVEEMVTRRYPLREAPQAFARAAERGALKVLLDAA